MRSERRFFRPAELVLSVSVVAMVAMLIVPLPTWLLDLLISTNLAAAVVVLLVALHVRGRRKLFAFPAVLLVTTLFRLSLNVSSTRLILLDADAGRVIDAFGGFVVRGDYVVGAVVFLILTIVQYVVIAKGAERIAEVGARFTLDALPGRQLAIDAELRSGAISRAEAGDQRRALTRESELYGAMDGAMKFVKGDAIAGLVITAINIAGGLAIGVALRGMSFGDALSTYGLLTIGDGLVSQLPALLIATSAGLVVTRVSTDDERSLGSDVARDLVSDPRALSVGGVLLLVLALVPGLPAAPFLVLGGALLMGSRVLSRRRRDPTATEAAHDGALIVLEVRDDDDVRASNALTSACRSIVDELGVTLPAPAVRIADDLEADGFRLTVSDLVVAEGALGDDGAQAMAGALRAHAASLLGVQGTQRLLDRIAATDPELVRSVVPRPLSVAQLSGLLRRLLEDGVDVRPFRQILETIAERGAAHGTERGREPDLQQLTEHVRAGLAPHLSKRFAPEGVVEVHVLDPLIEDEVRAALRGAPKGAVAALAPALHDDVIGAVRRARQESGAAPILTGADVRPHVQRLLRGAIADLVVLSPNDLTPDVVVRPRCTIAPG